MVYEPDPSQYNASRVRARSWGGVSVHQGAARKLHLSCQEILRLSGQQILVAPHVLRASVLPFSGRRTAHATRLGYWTGRIIRGVAS